MTGEIPREAAEAQDFLRILRLGGKPVQNLTERTGPLSEIRRHSRSELPTLAGIARGRRSSTASRGGSAVKSSASLKSSLDFSEAASCDITDMSGGGSGYMDVQSTHAPASPPASQPGAVVTGV